MPERRFSESVLSFPRRREIQSIREALLMPNSPGMTTRSARGVAGTMVEFPGGFGTPLALSCNEC
jgi:hypothetical protein